MKRNRKTYFRCVVTWILSIAVILSGYPCVACASQSPGKNDAVRWIMDAANAENAWEEGDLPNLTCDTMAVLRKEGVECDPSFLKQWESDKKESLNVDELAHFTWALQETKYLASLRKFQREDGGYGLTEDYTSDVYDTLLVLLAEISMCQENVSEGAGEEPDSVSISSAARYLLGKQRTDGGFGYTDMDESVPGLSAEIGLALLSAGVENEEFYTRLDTFCLDAFQGDFSEENFVEQAELARYLFRREKIENADLVEQDIYQVQMDNGSVYENVRDTLHYILLFDEIEEYHSCKLKVQDLATEADSYVLEADSDQQVQLKTTVKYTTNQEIKGTIRYTLLCNGVKQTTEKVVCTLIPDQTEQIVSAAMGITAEADQNYTLRTELLLYDEAGAETVMQNAEFSFAVHTSKKTELRLQKETSSGEQYGVDLSWNDISNEDDRYGYRLYRKQGEGAWETRSTWDGEERVKVLNIYPCADAKDYLVDWMEETVSDSEDPAGMGMFDIDTVYIGDYNSDPEKYLKDTQGDYRYDVLMFGTYDSNDWRDISNEAYKATQAFVDTGRGVLFGHDTIVSWMDNFAKFADQIGILLKPSYTRRDTTKVKVVKQGFLTNYPWKLSGMLTIPATHTQAQYTGGTLSADVWMELDSKYDVDEETGGMTNAYLFTKNQLAMIQTGHSNGQATDDERKVIANTLFYLKQLTEQTSAQDRSFYDEAAPEITEVSDINAEHQVTIQSEDQGTEYQYYVEAVHAQERDGMGIQSNVVRADALSGVKGYIIGTSDSDQEMEGLLAYDAEGNLVSEILPATDGNITYTVEDLQSGQSVYLHIYAVDYADNVSKEKVVKITSPKQTKEYLDSSYALFATDQSVTINCCSAEIQKNIYAQKDFCFGGSILHANGSVETMGKIAAYGWIIDIGERLEQVEERRQKNYCEDIISDIKNSKQAYNELEMYNSTSILEPTFCSGTTGAYCTNLTIQDSLVSKDSISINCNEANIGAQDKKSVLCSLDGDITVNATKAGVYGLIYAPNGTVSINISELNLTGTIIAKEIKLSGSYFTIHS